MPLIGVESAVAVLSRNSEAALRFGYECPASRPFSWVAVLVLAKRTLLFLHLVHVPCLRLKELLQLAKRSSAAVIAAWWVADVANPAVAFETQGHAMQSV